MGIKKRPGDAKPSIKTKALVKRLANKKDIITTLVSGRPVSDLLNFFKNLDKNINLIGSHGAEIKYNGKNPYIIESVKKIIDQLGKIKDDVGYILKEFSCFYIEDKKVSFAIHYRNCHKKDLINLEKTMETINNYKKKLPIDVIEGKKVIEVMPRNINKGKAVNILKNKYELENTISICIGDDVTDEHMFEKNIDGLNIKVARKKVDSNASYYLKNVGDVQKFLQTIIQAFQ